MCRINSQMVAAIAMAMASTATLAAGVGHISASPTVAAGYSLTTFAAPFTTAGLNQGIIPGASQVVSAPDDITVAGNSVFIGWGSNVMSDGSDGSQSVVAQYTLTGRLINHFNVTGHVEGMAMGNNGLLYTDENEDGNSALTVINTATGSQMRYGYPNPSVHGGGFDGLQFVNGNLYASGSNVKNNVVYSLTANNGFTLNQAYSSDKTNRSLDMLNFSTGVMTPIVTGLGGLAGIGFINDSVAVPEPATLALIILAAAGLLLMPRKRVSR